MSALVLNEDQLMFRDTAKRFAAERAPVSALRKLRDSNDAEGFSRSLWKEMASLGWAGVLIPEAHGGVGFGHMGAGLIAEEIGRNLSVTPLLSTAVLSVSALLKGGSNVQQQTWLPQIANGDVLLSVASDEQVRHAPYNVATRAEAVGGQYKLNGRKVHVLDGHVANQLIVSARTSGDTKSRTGITLFLVDARASGVEIQRQHIVDNHNAAVVEFKEVVVNADAVIGTLDQGATVLDTVLDSARAVLSAELLGVATETFERTMEYLRVREQFGVKIGTFQGLQHRAAHLFCELQLLRSTVLGALQALDRGDPGASKLVSLTKARASEISRIATNEGVQMHGGIGMTDEFDIGFFMKRARAGAESFGDAHFHTDRFAQLSGY